jgi:hypothetical protein
MRNAHFILTGNPEGTKLLGRPRHRWDELQDVTAGSGERGNELLCLD